MDMIAELISGASGNDKTEIAAKLQFTPEGKFGDIGFPCFSLSASMEKSAPEIASILKEKMNPPPEIEEIRTEGPYLNFKIRRSAVISDILTRVNEENENYGSSNEYAGKTVVMDYSSPNIAKPFGIGHLRSTVIGNSLMKIYRFQGYNAVGINHLGDWGTQFGKLIYAYKTWGDENELRGNPIGELFRLYVRFHKEAEKDPSLEELARESFSRLERGDPEAVRLWKRFKEYSQEEFDRIYKMLGIEFEHQTGESFYNDMMPSVIEDLREKGLAKVSRDALIVDLEHYGMPPCLLKKADEASLYATRDLAAAIYRHETFKFDKILYIVGVEQKLHFQQLFKVLELMGYNWASNCFHVEFGRIRFEGEEMSTRKGRIILLEEVLNKSHSLARKIIEEKNPDLEDKEAVAEMVGIGAVIFAQFVARRNKFISFSWDEALNFDGQTGPYLQYTHARLSSLNRKFGGDMPRSVNFDLLDDPSEMKLSKLLGQLPIAVKSALNENEPSFIANYLLNLAGEFNRYYQRVRIIVDDRNLAAARIALSNAVMIAIRNGLKLLGIKSPDKM